MVSPLRTDNAFRQQPPCENWIYSLLDPIHRARDKIGKKQFPVPAENFIGMKLLSDSCIATQVCARWRRLYLEFLASFIVAALITPDPAVS